MMCTQKVLSLLHARLKKILLDEAGQAVIEYTLVLVVVLFAFMGALYEFNKSFSSWADNYFGEYLACLLETGELPTLGGPGGECNQSFKDFTLSGGVPSTNSKGSGSGEGTGSEPTQPEAEDSSPSAALGGGGGSNVVQILKAPSLGDGRSSRFRANAGGGAEGEGDAEGSNTGSAQITDLGDGSGGKIVRIPLRNVSGYNGWLGKEKDEEKKEKFKISGPTGALGADEKTQRLIRVERKVASTHEVEIEEFTFGKFLRILIIVAIIIAIVLFIGGQLLQVSKSMD